MRGRLTGEIGTKRYCRTLLGPKIYWIKNLSDDMGNASCGASSVTRVDASGELFPPRPELRSGGWVRGSHLSAGCLGLYLSWIRPT